MSQPPRSISGNRQPPTTRLSWSEDLGKRVREGDWRDQAVSTVTKIEEAVAAGQWEPAAQLIDYFMEEAKVCHVIYKTWSEGFVTWLRGRGVVEAELEAELNRLSRLLALPDGTPFEPARCWEALGAEAGSLGNRLRGYEVDAPDAARDLDRLRESWRRLHDRWADLQSGLLTYVARRFGEAAIGDCYREVLEPYLQERYQPFDLREQAYADTVYRNLYLTFEAMRAHLCGPDRLGNLELEETEDSWVIRFDPCGSGNRAMRGDAIEGTGSRADPPYEFGVTTQEHDWAWNERGVCYYCAHCCFALELWPAENWGHPLRVVDSPLWPDEFGATPRKCSWTVYKSIEAIPAEAYERIGRTKPDTP